MSTLKDIAKKAGVSQSTVSRALNGNTRISEKTRIRINKIAQELDYHPDFSAKNLSRGQTQIIAVVFPLALKKSQPVDTFHLEIMRGINIALSSSDYKIMLVMGRNKRSILDQVESMVEEVKVEKFILLYSAENDPVITYLDQQDLDFVIIGHPFHHERFVDNNNFEVGRAATKLMLQNISGKNLTFIRTNQNRPFENDREAGYRQIMSKMGIKPKVFTVDEQGKIDDYIEELDGVVFSDDMLFLLFARQLLISDLPIVCFSDSEWIKLIFKNEKIIDLQPRLLGQRAVELLFNHRIDHILVPYRIERSKL